MKSTKKALQAMKRLITNRVIAVSALFAAVVVMMGYVSGNVRTITVSDGTENHSIVSLSKNAGFILRVLGVEVDSNDVVTEEWDFDSAEINITRAMDVVINVDGVMRAIVMTEGTVADALQKADVQLGEHDMLSIPADTVVTDEMTITVDRVTFAERVASEAIPFDSTSYKTSDYTTGEAVVVTAGVNGEKQYKYRDRLVNGEIVESELLEETVVKAPVTQVTAIGTRAKGQSLAQMAGPGSTADFTYSRVLYGKGTAYTNENGLCGKYTASGMLAQVGVVAVNPKVIPYGTRLYITTADGSYTYGYCVAGDTGGFIYSHPDTIVDMFFNTAAECYEFGRREVIVYVLD